MKSTATERKASLPGYSALRETESDLELSDEIVSFASGCEDEFSYRRYLDNSAYDKYMRIHKVLVGESGAKQLLQLADELAGEDLPRYLDTAGSAYAEAALVLKDESTVSRVQLISTAEDCWQRALLTSQELAKHQATEVLYGDTDQFRTALNLAYSPMTKALVIGNVTDTVRHQVFADTLAIAQTSSLQLELAAQQGQTEAVNDHVGFLHECNVLLSLLYLDDPRYIPMPSLSRADSGWYHGDQSHDVIILNQHWGKIKKVIPIEVKGKTSKRDISRYRALLVRGKMHLILNHGNNPVDTLEAFTNTHEGTASAHDKEMVDYATSNMLDLLRLYQRGSSKDQVKASSPTRFHDAQYVSPMYSGTVKVGQA